MVNIALGTTPLSACTAGDADHSGDITINEMIAAVNNALNGCSAGQHHLRPDLGRSREPGFRGNLDR
jgi:hypothetical protein